MPDSKDCLHDVDNCQRSVCTDVGSRAVASTPLRARMTAEQFNSRRATLVAYMLVKIDQSDFHGVSDAANDLRVLEAEWTAQAPQSIPQPASET